MKMKGLPLVVVFGTLSGLWAAPLAPSRWTVSGPNAAEFRKASDSDIRTAWVCPAPQKPGTGVTIDLNDTVYVHRVNLHPGEQESWFPRSLRVLVGETPESLELAAEEKLSDGPDSDPRFWLDVRPHPETSIRFAPKKGRFIRLEIGQNTAGYPWSIAELEVYAATKRAPEDGWNVVILDNGAPPPLRLAAEELRYYLTELLDSPTRIVTPDEAKTYRGLRVRLRTPPPEKLPYPDNDPPDVEDVSVAEEGDDIVISGPTQRAVLYAAYELLSRQGVRWLYPGPHGDFVPKLRSLRRSVLPIRYRPPFVSRYANFGVHDLASRTRTEEGFLFFARQHFNHTWGNALHPTLGGVPPRMSLGFGYIHNLKTIIPDQVLKEHPGWTPGPYRDGWDRVPCTSNPEVIDFVVRRIKEENEKRPEIQGFSIHPTDAPAFCECPNCIRLFGQPRKVQDDFPDGFAHSYDYSDHYFHLISEVAKRVQKELPGKGVFALAYANHGKPPRSIERLPDNVMVDVTLHWKHNLPVDSPLNAPFRKEIEAWAGKCRHLGIYDYVLIHTDTTFGRPAGEWFTVVPLVSAIADHHRFFHRLGVTAVGTQAMGDICWSSPWSVYAYARTAWNPEEPVETVLSDFFGGFYGKAAKPMLRWYKALEDHILKNNVAYSGGVGTYGPSPEAFPKEVVATMRTQLAEAQKRADTWYVRERVAHAAKCTEWSHAVAHGQDGRPVYPCYRLKTPPKIDGRMDDEAWNTLPSQTGFRVATTNHYAFTRQSSFRIGWDSENLYFGAHCVEPDTEAVRKRTTGEPGYVDISKVSWAQFYHDLLEIFWAPCEPVYFQTMVNAIGQYVGPNRHVGHMHDRKPISRDGFECRTTLGDGWWEAEIKFPFASLGYAPTEGQQWKANVVRVSSQDLAKGEQFTSWPHLERFHFHERSQFNRIVFRGQVLVAEEVTKLEAGQNQEFDGARLAYDGFRARAAAFEEKARGKPNLAASAAAYGMGRNVNLILRGGGEGWSSYGRMPQVATICWKEPVELNALRVQWGSRKEFPDWYGIEWYDGETYRPLVECRDNRFETAAHEFETIKTSRVRLTVLRITGGSTVTLARSLEAFKL